MVPRQSLQKGVARTATYAPFGQNRVRRLEQ
uniref:Uncharacterized protein n=1 Tax=Arundo donax TaxID=35708 RepID=A0A0A9A697_ARUDO